MGFTPRLNAPSTTDKYWISTGSGGYNRCIYITGNSVIPNCVGYAYGRFMEIMGATSCNLSINNAENWWGNTGDGYERGQTPKLGAVICWRAGQIGYEDDGAGHVAIVEQINSDGSIVTSNSAWGGTRFYTETLQPPNYNMGSGFTFQGFIYNPSGSNGANKVTEFLDEAYKHVGQNNKFVVQTLGCQNNQRWSTTFVTACAKVVSILGICIPNVNDPGGFGRTGTINNMGKWVTRNPESGDIIIFRYQADAKYYDEYAGDHSGIVRELKDNVVYTIEGDSDNKVQLKCYASSSDQIHGYFRPAWSKVNGFSVGTNIVNMGQLYTTKNTRKDASIREVSYMSINYEPSISSLSGITLSAINYTDLLAAFFNTVVVRSSGNQDVITDGVTNQNARVILEFLLNKGLTAAQAVGFLANIQQESGFRPDAVNPDSYASGICQWFAGRRTAMIDFVGPDWKSDLTGQCEYLWSELQGSEHRTLDRVTQEVTANTEEGAKQATIIVLYQFERPGKSEAVEHTRCSNASELWSQLVVQLIN